MDGAVCVCVCVRERLCGRLGEREEMQSATLQLTGLRYVFCAQVSDFPFLS